MSEDAVNERPSSRSATCNERPDDLAHVREARVLLGPREAEVDEHDPPRFLEKNVRRLQSR